MGACLTAEEIAHFHLFAASPLSSHFTMTAML